ncbi:MAG: PAS domain-containing sensor histidine kinase, partial [Candidatus Syntropharchaeales archaeon]
NDMVAIMDTSGRIIKINEIAEEKLGFRNEEIAGLKFNELDWFEEQLKDEIEPYFGEVSAGEIIEAREIALITADGRSIPSLFSMAPILDESSGEVLGLIAQAIDISKLKEFSNELLLQKEELLVTTEELESSKAYLETLIDTIPSALFTVDREQNITLWNRAAEEITGYEKEEVLEKNCHFLEEECCAEVCPLLDDTVVKPIIGKECTIKTKDGRGITISKNVSELRDISGEIIGGIESFVDITKRKEAARIIEASEAKFRTLVENLHAGVFRCTINGDYIEANPALLEILGANTKEELMNSNAQDVFLTEEMNSDVFTMLRRDGMVTGFELPLKKLDGHSVIWASLSLKLVDDGKDKYIDGIVEDITEKKELQNKLRYHAEELQHEVAMATAELKVDKLKLAKAYADLKELDELKTQFFSNVSHELKTPLTVIKAHLKFLKSGKLGDLTAQMKHSIDVASMEVVDLEDLIGMILDLARLDSGKLKLDLVETVITDLAEDIVERMRKNAEERGQKLILDVNGEIPERAIDPKRMKQVLMNLVSNSIKYNPESTTTTIKIYTDSKNIIIDVIDDGVGIEKKDLEKIFDRFYQVDGSSTRSGSGTGIGLSIVKELVELHGGNITVESEVGAGSTFRVSLPMD